jgi:hypothetical protein
MDEDAGLEGQTTRYTMNPQIRTDPGSFIRESDRALKERSYQSELVNLHGWRKLVRRLRIECWAWAKTLSEKSKDPRSIE